MCYEIQTPRLALAAFTKGDLPRQVELANDLAVVQMTSSMPFPFTMPHAKKWIEDQAIACSLGAEFNFSVSTAKQGLLGGVGLYKKSDGVFDLGYWLGRQFWGNGYACEAAKAILSWAEQTKQIKVISAGYYEDNPASGRVLEKCGFLRTGVKTKIYSKARGVRVTSIQMIWLGTTGASL